MATPHVDELYTEYLNGTLPPAQRDALEAHLAACPACTAGLAEMRQVVAAVHALPTLKVPDGLAACVQARISLPRRHPWGWGLAAGLAACLLVVVVLAGRVTAPPRIAAQPVDTVKVAAAPAKPMPLPLPKPSVTYDLAPAAPPTPKLVPIHVPDPFTGGVDDRRARNAAAPATNEMHGNTVQDDAAPGNNRVTWMKDRKPDAKTEVEVPADATGPLVIHVGTDKKISISAAEKSKSTAPTAAPGPPGPTGPPAAGMPAMRGAAQLTAGAPAPMAAGTMCSAKMENGIAAYDEANTVAVFRDGPAAQQTDAGAVRVTDAHLPAGKAGAIVLDLSACTAKEITWQSVLPLRRDSKRALEVADKRLPVTIPAAVSADGAALRLTLTAGAKTGELYLFTPGTRHEARVTLQLDDRPMVLAVQRLATDAGIFVLCPADFAEQPVHIDVKNMRPLDALADLANHLHYTVTLFKKTLANIAPAK